VVPAGQKRSKLTGRLHDLACCPECHFALVVEPRSDFGALYDEDYYRGQGANPHDDYFADLAGATTRRHAWSGMLRIVASLTAIDTKTRWLDYGCGLGAFVRHLRAHGFPLAVGHDVGFAAEWLRTNSPSLLAGRLSDTAGAFDVVTAVEVIEHTLDPVAELTAMRQLLRPGGLLFLSTGNARPFRTRLDRWGYVVPDVHVSFFEPETLARALARAGLVPEFPGFVDGWTEVIRYKVVHLLPAPLQPLVDRLVPWRVVSPIVDRYFGVSAHPIGRAV
jgi:SAM-dependent methyltransferase